MVAIAKGTVPLPGSAWADGKLAELAEHLGKMVEHPKPKSTQPRFARRCVTLYVFFVRPLTFVVPVSSMAMCGSYRMPLYMASKSSMERAVSLFIIHQNHLTIRRQFSVGSLFSQIPTAWPSFSPTMLLRATFHNISNITRG